MNTRLTWMVAVLCIAGVASPVPAAQDQVAAAMTRHGIQPAATAARENPRWRKPVKIVLLTWGQPWQRVEEIRRLAAGATVVLATDVASAAAAATDADVIIGRNPEICDPRIVNNAKQLRWLASLNAGVELCMGLPA